MRLPILILLFNIFLTLNLSGQTDQAAKGTLDRFSNRATEAESVTMRFKLITNDAAEGSETESDGEIVIAGNMYKLTLPDNIIWFDGSAIYTLVPDVEEVTITEPDDEEETFFSAPSNIFTMYRDGYKIKLISESPEGSIIDLYPEELTAEFSRIRLQISRSFDLVMAEYKRKDGLSMILRIEEYNLKKSYPQNYFSFDSRKYRNAEIIDMRF